MLTCLRNCIYYLIVESRIIFYISPILQYAMKWGTVQDSKEELIRDEDGSTMTVTKWNGKVYPAFGQHRLSTIKDIRIRKDDILLCGYPKTGCHWVYEILYMLGNKRAKLSKYGKYEGGMIDAVPDIILDSVPSLRVLNSHMLYAELPKGIKENKTKIILTIRSAKDTVVSFYNHSKKLKRFYNYDGLFENYFKWFMKGELDYGSYFDFYLSWNEARKLQNDNQIFFLEFEDLKKETVKKVLELAQFLEIPITTQFAEEVAEASKFSNMKKKRVQSVIFRKGIVGDWENWLTQAQIDEIDSAWNEKMIDFWKL